MSIFHYFSMVTTNKQALAFNLHTKAHARRPAFFALDAIACVCFAAKARSWIMHVYKCKCAQTPHRFGFWQCVINSVFSVLSHSQHPKNSWRTLAPCPASLTVNKLSSPSHRRSTLKPTVPQPLTAPSPKHLNVYVNNSNLDSLWYVITHHEPTLIV